MNQHESSRENARENTNARTRSDNSVNSMPCISEKDDAYVASYPETTTTAELSTCQSSEEEGQGRDGDGMGMGDVLFISYYSR